MNLLAFVAVFRDELIHAPWKWGNSSALYADLNPKKTDLLLP